MNKRTAASNIFQDSRTTHKCKDQVHGTHAHIWTHAYKHTHPSLPHSHLCVSSRLLILIQCRPPLLLLLLLLLSQRLLFLQRLRCRCRQTCLLIFFLFLLCLLPLRSLCFFCRLYSAFSQRHVLGQKVGVEVAHVAHLAHVICFLLRLPEKWVRNIHVLCNTSSLRTSFASSPTSFQASQSMPSMSTAFPFKFGYRLNATEFIIRYTLLFSAWCTSTKGTFHACICWDIFIKELGVQFLSLNALFCLSSKRGKQGIALPLNDLFVLEKGKARGCSAKKRKEGQEHAPLLLAFDPLLVLFQLPPICRSDEFVFALKQMVLLLSLLKHPPFKPDILCVYECECGCMCWCECVCVRVSVNACVRANVCVGVCLRCSHQASFVCPHMSREGSENRSRIKSGVSKSE